MKKTLNVLILCLFLLLVVGTLMFFEIPPFTSKKTASTQNNIPLTGQNVNPLNTEKISRNKSFDEYMQRAKALDESGYSTLAIKEYDAAFENSPTRIEPLIEKGRIALRTNDPLQAKVSFEQALKLDPKNISVKIYLSRSLLSLRKISEAKTVLDTIDNDTQTSWYYKGIVAAYNGDYENSKTWLNKAADLNDTQDITDKAKNFLTAYKVYASEEAGQTSHLKTLLAKSFNQTGEFQVAIPLLFEVIKEKKDYRDAWILLGYAYLGSEKYQDAVEALEEAKKLDNEKSESYFFAGLSYYGLQNLSKAAENLELAKKFGYQPKVQIDQKLAEIYLQMKEYQKSAQSYENVVSLNNSDINYFIKPIWIYLDRLNHPEQAFQLAEKALQSHPDDAMSYNLLGWTSIGANKLKEAEIYLAKAQELNPDLDAIYLNWGLLNEKKGLLNQAIDSYKKAYEMGKGNSISSSAASHYNDLIGRMKNLNYAATADVFHQ